MVQAWGNFAFDRLGRVTQYTDYFNGGQVDYVYTYDTAGRLTHVFDGASTTTYTYDDAGNRLTRARTGQPTETGVYNALDQLVSYDGRTYTYDDAGRLASVTGGGQTTTYTWDVWGQLRRVDLPGGGVIEYAIDGAGRRVGRKKNGAWTARWVYGAGLGPVAELDADGYVAKRFVYGRHANVPDYVVTLTRTSTTTLESVAAVVHDRRGGVRELIAMSDSLSPVHTTYDEYGRVSDPNPVNVGVAVPFGFAGGMFDPETGLVHLGAREYDPQTGRWLTPDPIGFAGGPNLYGYVLADPINYIDPSGFGPDGSLGFFGDSQFWGDWWSNISTLDNLQTGLDAAGLIPVLGVAPDLINAGISAGRGNWGTAAFSLACAIPIVGDAAGAGKIARNSAVELGKIGEKAAGIVKNTKHIDSLTGTAKYRIPDVLNEFENVIGEVKNVRSLSYTNQLRDYVAYSQQQGYTFELMVRQNTQLSGPLQQAVDSGLISLRRILP